MISSLSRPEIKWAELSSVDLYFDVAISPKMDLLIIA